MSNPGNDRLKEFLRYRKIESNIFSWMRMNKFPKWFVSGWLIHRKFQIVYFFQKFISITHGFSRYDRIGFEISAKFFGAKRLSPDCENRGMLQCFLAIERVKCRYKLALGKISRSTEDDKEIILRYLYHTRYFVEEIKKALFSNGSIAFFVFCK
ncbi:MAG: hypothetical protein ACD_78C00105G0006 [uncultured bacterium (gcode 4)]|uniref:Uncharacterized protein n=1 Tax=uncultured bacterium (gcode 4) TaxID=1234023 RepID=K1XZ74_9BACT|nr:MAG: hypothetical protein ACD_78C00105G0006 [uncultured bacterium (gcode 4)]